MCKRNSPDKNEASTGCVRETPQIKIKSAWEMEEKLPRLKKEASTGRVRETPHIKIKPAWDVQEKLPR